MILEGGIGMDKKIKKVLLLLLLVSVFIAGCSSGSKSAESAPMKDSGKYENIAEDMTVEGEVGFDGGLPQRNKNQKLVYRASMNVEVVQKLDTLIQSVQAFVSGHDGYIENMEQYRIGYDPITQEQLEAIFMRIRIPHEHYDKALQTIAELGTVINKNSSVEDVTLQYSDIESTLKMYKVEQDRLLQMLEKETIDVADMIEIEKRLSEVRIELEKQESARRSLESQINYDTIELEMRQVRRVSDINNTKSFGSRIKAAFIDSIDSVIIISQELVLGLTYMAIPIIILLFIVGIIYILALKIRKKRRSQAQAKVKAKEKEENNAD